MIKSPIKRVLQRRPPRAAALRAARLACVVAVAFATITAGGISSLQSLAARQGPGEVVPVGEVRVLAAGEVVGRRMEAGAAHSYELALEAGQFARVVVEQRGVDVGVRVSAPGGELLVDMDSPNGFYGREAVSVLAASAGGYRVEVYSDKSYPPGDYELRVEGPRAASAADETRVKAERVFAEAQGLRGEAGGLSGEEAAAKFAAAEKKYDEALGLWRELGEPRGQGYALTYLGRFQRTRGQLAPALKNLGEALALLAGAGEVSGQAYVLNETGAAHRDLGDLRDAVSSYKRALELRLGLGDRWGQAQLYNNLGLAYSLMGYQPQAGESYEKALPLWRALGMRGEEMRTLNNAAKAHAETGDVGLALAQYQEVLAFCDAEAAAEGSPLKPFAAFLKPYALNGLGLVYDTWADTGAALDSYGQALELFRANKNGRGEADVLDNLGMARAFLGDARPALDYFTQALAIRERLNEPRGWAATLSNIGYAHTLLGQHEKALKHLNLALPLSRRARDRRFEAYTLVWTGTAHVARREPRLALESYEKALAIQQEEGFADRRGQAITLDKMGEALALAGESAAALERYGRALELWKAVGDEQGRALSLYGLARVESGRQNLANARDRVEEAVGVVERLRGRVGGRQLRMTYFASRQDFYRLAVDVRMRLYELTRSAPDVEAALSLSERARARSLVDLLTEARAGLPRGMSPQDEERSLRLEREIVALTQTLLRLRGLGNKEGAAAVERKLAAHMREQDGLQAAATKSGAPTAAAVAGRPLSAAEMQRLLDDDTLLLQYSLGERRSHLWAVTRAGIEHHFIAGGAEVEGAAKRLWEALTAYEPRRPGQSDADYLSRLRGAPEQYRQSALELGRMLLAPVAPRLGDKRLVVAADGVLQYIPFESLLLPAADAAQPPAQAALLLRNEVVYQPSASTLALLRGSRRRAHTSKTVAVLADPVFDSNDRRVRAAGGGQVAAAPRAPSGAASRPRRDVGDVGGEAFPLTKLEYSLQEANAITAVAPRGSWMKAVGFKASRATATSPALRQFAIVHFATHGVVNEEHPELSGIVLSLVDERGRPADGFLSMRDVYRLDLPAELVVLSACQTGVGKRVPGEGLIGLTWGFMYAGAPRVVVSLWRVDDEATAELMKRFYRHMLGKDRLTAAAALRRAKVEMAQEGGRWSAPYYWAGFVLQGDWK
jgi:CHAT domain-containing protein/tetratricopeptide (TPR) repeat protein